MCVSPAILIIDSREEEEDKTTYIHDGVSCCCSILFSLFIFMLDFEMNNGEGLKKKLRKAQNMFIKTVKLC